MPKPTDVTPHQYQALSARHAAAKQAREQLEFRLSQSARSGSFHLALNEAEQAELEAWIAAEQGGAAYNRSASDLESIRSFLETELATARKVYAQPAPNPPQPLFSAAQADLARYVDGVLAHQAAVAVHREAIGPAYRRLVVAYAAARQAQQIVFAARKAAGLPPPTNVTPQDPRTNHASVPGSIAEIDRDLEAIKAQRTSTAQTGAESEAERRLRELRREREEYEAEVAAQAEADRIEALPPAERRLELERLRIAAAE